MQLTWTDYAKTPVPSLISSIPFYLRHTQKSIEKEYVPFLSMVAVPITCWGSQRGNENRKHSIRFNLTLLQTGERWHKHDAKAEVLDTYHDSFMKLTKGEIQHSYTQFSKGKPQENEETSRSSQKRKIFESSMETMLEVYSKSIPPVNKDLRSEKEK